MREVDLFSLINQMVDHGAVLPSCSHAVDLFHCLHLTISIISMHTTLQFITAAARVVHSLPRAGCPEFQVLGDVANLLNARFAPKRPREMTSCPIDRP